jgi:hypothetical protein
MSIFRASFISDVPFTIEEILLRISAVARLVNVRHTISLPGTPFERRSTAKFASECVLPVPGFAITMMSRLTLPPPEYE